MSRSNAFVVTKMADEDEGESASDPLNIKIIYYLRLLK